MSVPAGAPGGTSDPGRTIVVSSREIRACRSVTNGDSWLVVTSIVDDPQYLDMPLMLTTHFKREPDRSKFQPRPCEVMLPVIGAPQ